MDMEFQEMFLLQNSHLMIIASIQGCVAPHATLKRKIAKIVPNCFNDMDKFNRSLFYRRHLEVFTATQKMET